MESELSLDFTYHWDKYSCIRSAYFAHIVFSYLIMLSGLGCLIARVVPALKVGRSYIITMFWGMTTSLLIHNTVLPEAVLWSFLWVLLGLCIGWVVIIFHSMFIADQDMNLVQQSFKHSLPTSFNLKCEINRAKATIADSRSLVQRLQNVAWLPHVHIVDQYCRAHFLF